MLFLKIIGIILLLLLIGLLLIILIKGKGKAILITDEKGDSYIDGISTREKININGSEQYIFLTGENKNNPILLYLHGGPGTPEVGLFSFEPGKRLEEEFVVCYWEQRGSGLSYESIGKNETLDSEMLIADTIALTEYLLNRFEQQKIYIMGHSWGAFLGTQAIQRHPEYYHAYFGIGQVTNQGASERLAYEYMLEHAKEIDDVKAIGALEKVDFLNERFPTTDYLLSTRGQYMNKYGIGMMHEENFKMSKILKQVFWFKGYSANDFLKFLLGNLKSTKQLVEPFMKINLFEKETEYSVPIYIFHGKYDYQVSYELSRKYFDTIQAPIKEFYSFDQSAHSPNFEEPEKFIDLVFTSLKKGDII